ncbi:MAG: alcohol dehydrogenase catalytic domain-containing protein [Myxococcota bacterium]|nr:alcohol dehydrogenase catalytic domain-containing protein [Myxococcota bacterium]
MRAVRAANGGVEVVQVPPPVGEGVRVRVAAAGICGSDLHILDVGMPTAGTLGHEFAGRLPDGRPVAVEPLAPCGDCAPCRSGEYNLCERGPGMLLGIGLDGGMAEEVIVPERALVPLPAGVDAKDACLVEPLAVAVHGLRRLPRGPTRVAVIGGGTIGLCAVAAARAGGAEVALVARHAHQREAGTRLGAVPAEGLYDVTVDCAGNAAALREAVDLCRPGGTLLLLATYWDDKLELPGFALTLKEIDVMPGSLYGRRGAARDVDVAAALLAREPAIAETLVTHRFPLDAAPEAFATARDRASGSIKVVLEP